MIENMNRWDTYLTYSLRNLQKLAVFIEYGQPEVDEPYTIMANIGTRYLSSYLDNRHNLASVEISRNRGVNRQKRDSNTSKSMLMAGHYHTKGTMNPQWECEEAGHF